MPRSGFTKIFDAFKEHLSGLEKISVIATILIALLAPASSAIFVMGQQQNVLNNLNSRLNTLPTEEEFNLQLQLRDVRLQRIEYKQNEIIELLNDIKEKTK